MDVVWGGGSWGPPQENSYIKWRKPFDDDYTETYFFTFRFDLLTMSQ